MHKLMGVIVTHDGSPNVIQQRLQLNDKTQYAATILEIPHAQCSGVGQGNEELSLVHGRHYTPLFDNCQASKCHLLGHTRSVTALRDETDLDALTGELARVVQETMQPVGVNVWLKESAPVQGRR